MYHFKVRLSNWSAILLFVFIIFFSSCFWINEPKEDEIGSLELSAEEISGETYSYKIFLNDSSNVSRGYGFVIILNNRELIKQSYENIDGEIESYKSVDAASAAAETKIDYLKSSSKQDTRNKSDQKIEIPSD